MNCFNGIGRLTKDPDISQTQSGIMIAKYTLAIDRQVSSDSHPEADFIRCICFGKTAEFVRNYLSKGMKIGISGRIQTGSYDDKNGNKIYTTDIVVNSHTFCERATLQQLDTAGKVQKERRAAASKPTYQQPAPEPLPDLSDFEEVISDGELPF